MKTVLVSGQSNAMGRGTGGPSFSGVDSRVNVWNNVNPLGANGSAFVSASAARTAGTFENTDRNNFGVWFCHRLAQVRDDDVRMTMVARGATTIAEWAPGAAVPMLAEITSVWAATGQGPADVFLWHQGEANVNVATPYATYKTAFLALLANLTSAGVINASTDVIVGGLSEDNSDRVNFNISALQALASENAQIFYAPSDGLSSYDGTHFTGTNLYTLGAERYFAAYTEAEGIIMADLFALVNEGGTPGAPGTGTNKLYNLLDLALLGMGKKNTTLSPAFNGTPPVGNLLTAGMIAAGAIVDFGSHATNGSWARFENGLQVCWNKGPSALAATAASGALFSASPAHTFTFPKPFSTPPIAIGVADKSTSGTGNIWANVGTTSPTTTGVVVGLTSSVNTSSAFPAYVAIGFWK